MAKNEKYIVPQSDRKEFDRLVQRANRRILQGLKYIQENNIKSDRVQRALVSDYVDRSNWNTQKTVFSRSIKFNSKKEYEQYKRHISQWGSVENQRDEESIKAGYYKSIVKALTTVAIDTGNLDEKGRLPRNLARRIKNLSLEQMVHFFDDDPTELIEGARWNSYDYEGADMGQFVDITATHINTLRKLYPKPRKPRSDKGKKRKKK